MRTALLERVGSNAVPTPPQQRTAPRPVRSPVAHDAAERLKIRDLTLWQRSLRDVEFAGRPAYTSRPNPLVVDSLVVASTWSPGAIRALDRDRGRPVWRRSMGPLAHDTVYHAEGLLYLHALHTLYALEPATGKTVWSWRPALERGLLRRRSAHVTC